MTHVQINYYIKNSDNVLKYLGIFRQHAPLALLIAGIDPSIIYFASKILSQLSRDKKIFRQKFKHPISINRISCVHVKLYHN